VFLGIDIGTSGVKAAVIQHDGTLVADATAPLTSSRPHEGWSEQNPSDWWAATQRAVLELSQEQRRAIRAIGLTGQMHGATLLNDRDEVLRPAILWNDGRCEAECRDLQEQQPDFLRKGGNLVMPGFTAPKLEWVRRHEPEVFAQVAKVLLPKDYIRLLMTGSYASDMSDSAGTLWLDVEKRRWHEPLLEACGLTAAQMPELFEGTDATGELSSSVADVWGMDRVPVFAGGGDNAAGAAAVGVLNEGQAILSLGTSGVVFAATDVYRFNPESAVHAFCHALPQRWHLMSVMLSAASCLNWACQLTGVANVGDFIDLAEAASPGGELFLPYLSGERTPHNDPHARGVFFGLNHDTDKSRLARSVLEGVAFGLAEGYDRLIAAGAELEDLSVIGGGARSAYWGTILASALRHKLTYRNGGTVGPALGAAKLAAFGLQGGSISDAFAPPPQLTEVNPDPALVEQFAAKRAQFHQLYQSLKPNFLGASHV